MSAIGKRVLNLFIGADISFYKPSDASTVTKYRSIGSFLTNTDDSVAANRQYIGQMTKGLDFNFTLFSPENNIGGRTQRNFGELRLFKPNQTPNPYSLDDIFEDNYSVQDRPIIYRMGEKRQDLADMITLYLRGRHVYPSSDGTEVVIDVADGGQSLDTSIQLDRFWGLGFASRYVSGETGSLPDDTDFDPTSGWYLDIAYRLPNWTTLPSDAAIITRDASGGGYLYRITFLATGKIRVESVDSSNVTATLDTTDLEWVADGRWHRVCAKWDGALLSVFHSNRTGGVKSVDTEALASVAAGGGDLVWGDASGDFEFFDYVDIAELRLSLDGNIPTDGQIIERMHRPLTDDEGSDCEVWLQFNENTSIYAFDDAVTNVNASSLLSVTSIANGNTVTINGKVYTAETVLTNVDGHFLIGASDYDTINNFAAAVVLGAGAGTLYAAATTAHPDVTAAQGSSYATGTLTGTTIADGNTVTLNGKVYTFQNTLTDVDGNVKVGLDDSESLDNLIAGIRLGPGAGVKYAASMTLHATMTASAGSGDTLVATAKTSGEAGNALTTTATLTAGGWGAATLTGGADALLATAKVTGEIGNAITVAETISGSWAGSTMTGGVGHTATVVDDWVNSFEGPAEFAGKAKPLSFGHIFNAPVFWTDQGNGAGSIHARTFVGVKKVFEGGERRVVGWQRNAFRNLSFDTSTGTISFPARTSGGASRIDAQPGLCGLVAGQVLVLEAMGSGVNAGTYTLLEDSDERSVVVDEPFTGETGEDYFVTALKAGSADPEVEVWHDAGALRFLSAASLPSSAEIIGDIGTEIPTDSASVSAPEYTAAIMRTILIDWAGEPDVAANWDDAVTGPTESEGSYFADAGVWISPESDTTMRSVLDEGGDSIWASWGENYSSDEWDLYQVLDPTGETADIEMTLLEMHGIEQVACIAPIGGYTLECSINYAPLAENDLSGVVRGSEDEDILAEAESLQREKLTAEATPDAAVVEAYPTAEKPTAVRTWIRYKNDGQVEAQRRYDILKVKRDVFKVSSWLYGLDKNLQHCFVNLTTSRFPSLVSGKTLMLIGLAADNQSVSLMLWG